MKHSEQLRGWAIDRAIEFIKYNQKSEVYTAQDLTAIATIFCDYCFDPGEMARADEAQTNEQAERDQEDAIRNAELAKVAGIVQ